MKQEQVETKLVVLRAARTKRQSEVDELTEEIDYLEGLLHTQTDGWCIKDQNKSCDCPKCELDEVFIDEMEEQPWT